MMKWWPRVSLITLPLSPSPIFPGRCNRLVQAQAPWVPITPGERTPLSWAVPYWAEHSMDQEDLMVLVFLTAFRCYNLAVRTTPIVIAVNGYQLPRLISMQRRWRHGTGSPFRTSL